MSDMNKINENATENVSGGYGNDSLHNLDNYVYRTVGNLPAGECLVMQYEPGGAFMGEQYWPGDPIFVHPTFWENGYLLAYRNGVFGFVDARYVF